MLNAREELHPDRNELFPELSVLCAVISQALYDLTGTREGMKGLVLQKSARTFLFEPDILERFTDCLTIDASVIRAKARSILEEEVIT